MSFREEPGAEFGSDLSGEIRRPLWVVDPRQPGLRYLRLHSKLERPWWCPCWTDAECELRLSQYFGVARPLTQTYSGYLVLGTSYFEVEERLLDEFRELERFALPDEPCPTATQQITVQTKFSKSRLTLLAHGDLLVVRARYAVTPEAQIHSVASALFPRVGLLPDMPVDVAAVLCKLQLRGRHTIEALQGEDPSVHVLKQALEKLL